ncbi:MAG: hypothetical protein ABMA64_32295 [Myxococcota bacterium]
MSIAGLTKIVLHSSAVATFDASDWRFLGLRTAQLAWMRSHPRFFRALSFGDEDFDAYSLEVVDRILAEEANVAAFLEFPKLVAKLQTDNPGVLTELQAIAARHPGWKGSNRGVWLLGRAVVATFGRADWLKLGMLANCREEVVGHARLLRALDFGDSDYAGLAVEMVGDILGRQDDNYKLLGHFPELVAWLREHSRDAADRLFPVSSGQASPVRGPASADPGLSTAPIPDPPFAPVPPPQPPPWATGVLQPPGPLDALQGLLRAIEAIEAGNDGASSYHSQVAALLEHLFEGELTDPVVEDRLHDGRKRVDITFTNRGRSGFFGWLAQHYPPVPNVFVECKNYAGDPGNPAADQLSGRFSPNRGKFGLLLCRSLGDHEQFIRRCRDTLSDQRGIVLPLDDGDLAELVRLAASEGREQAVFQVLKRRLDRLVK